MRAIVIGAGVSGSAAAIGLRRIGAEVTVYELNPDSGGAVGSFLSLASNGLRALECLGCLDRVRRVGVGVPWQRMWSSGGRRLGQVARGRLNGDSMISVTLRRADLVTTLRAEAELAGAQIVTGRRLVGATLSQSSVRAEFDNGTTNEADLLVGADGIWSITRRLLDPDAPQPQYAGIWSVSGISDNPTTDHDQPGVFNLTFARCGVFLHLTAADGRIWWSAQVSGPSPGSTSDSRTSPDVELATLLALFRHERTPSRILRATTELQRPTLEHVLAPVEVWHNARIVLAGDAAHPVGSGQGASMALEDAVQLAADLAALITPTTADPPSLEAALARYVAARRIRTTKMVAMASANRDAKTAGPVGRRVQALVMPIVFRFFYARVTAWLYTDPTPSMPTPSPTPPRTVPRNRRRTENPTKT